MRTALWVPLVRCISYVRINRRWLSRHIHAHSTMSSSSKMHIVCTYQQALAQSPHSFAKPFEFLSLGVLAYLGNNNALAQVRIQLACMDMRVYTRVWMCVYVYVLSCVRVWIRGYMQCMCIYTCLRVLVHFYVSGIEWSTHDGVCACAYVLELLHTYRHTYIHTYVYIHTCTNT